MEKLLRPDFIPKELAIFKVWLIKHVFTYSTLAQGLIIVCALLIAILIGNRLTKRIAKLPLPDNRFGQAVPQLLPLTYPVLWFLLQILSLTVATAANWPQNLINLTVSLLAVWIIIQITSSLIPNHAWGKLIAFTAWTIAALNIMGLLGPTIALLDQLAIKLGGLRVSALTLIEGVIALALLLWLARFLTVVIEKRIQTVPGLSPSIQVLFIKLLKIVLITIAIIVALGVVGIDLTAFTIFTGAIGVGIGFGLQKIVSNLISGIILLLDKSIKPGDVITVGETYGWVNSLGARYTSLITRDGKEFLVPNEDLITHQVENWSFSNNAVRLKLPIGISYKSDVRKAIALCTGAAAGTQRILKDPPPICLLVGFGDSSVDLELRFWITDPVNGLMNVQSDVLLKVWDKFHEHGIEIPFPQRDLHIRSPLPVPLASAPDSPKK